MTMRNTCDTNGGLTRVRTLLSLVLSVCLALQWTPIAFAEDGANNDTDATVSVVDYEGDVADKKDVADTPEEDSTGVIGPAGEGDQTPTDSAGSDDTAATDTDGEATMDDNAAAESDGDDDAPETEGTGTDDTDTDGERTDEAVGDESGEEPATPDESSPADEPVDMPADVAMLSFVLDHATVTYGLGTIDAQSSAISINAGEAVSFVISADEGYEVDEVNLSSDAGEQLLVASEDGTYVIDASLVHGNVSVKVTTRDAKVSESAKRGYVYEKPNTKESFVYENKHIKVTAKLSDPAALPEGATFKVRAVTAESKEYNYEAYMEALNKKALEDVRKEGLPDEEAATYSEDDTLLYDVGFFAQKADSSGNPVEGEEVEVSLAQGTVELSFEFKKDQLEETLDATEEDDIEVTHLPLKTTVREAVDSTAEATEITVDDIVVESPKADSVSVKVEEEKLDFTLSSLSLVALRTLGAADNGAIETEPILVQKAYYGDEEIYNAETGLGIFTFRLCVATRDENGVFRALSGSNINTLTVTNGPLDEASKLAPVTFDLSLLPVLKEGVDHFIISENAIDGCETEQAEVLVSVNTVNGVPSVTYYALREANGNVIDMTAEYLAGTQQAVLYNNGLVTVAQEVPQGSASYVAFEPEIKKELRGGVLEAGEFVFELVDEDGFVVDTATNDRDGVVAFDALGFDADDAGKTFDYTIRESTEGATKNADGSYTRGDVRYSSSSIELQLEVDIDDATNVLTVKESYKGGDVGTDKNVPTLVNISESVVVRIALPSSSKDADGNYPHYGLWMHNPDGADIYLEEGRNQIDANGALYESNAQGEMYFDLPTTEGIAYYFREQGTPPKGRLPNPYPSDYFTLEHTETGGYKLTYEGDVGTRDEFLEYVRGIYAGN